MPDSAPPISLESAKDRFRWLAPPAGAVLAAGASIASLSLAGPFQGVLFSAVTIVTLIVPAISAGMRSTRVVLTAALAVGLGAMLGPAIALRDGSLNSRAFTSAGAVVISLSFAAAGLCLMLRLLVDTLRRTAIWSVVFAAMAGVLAPLVLSIDVWSPQNLATVAGAATTAFVLLRLVKHQPAYAAWVVVVVLLLWLAWPIWLSPWLPGRENWVDLLSPAHPLLAIDAVLTRENIAPWTEHRLMYSRLTVLQQHVASHPPKDIFASVLLNVAIAVPGIAAAIGFEILRKRKDLKANRPLRLLAATPQTVAIGENQAAAPNAPGQTAP